MTRHRKWTSIDDLSTLLPRYNVEHIEHITRTKLSVRTRRDWWTFTICLVYHPRVTWPRVQIEQNKKSKCTRTQPGLSLFGCGPSFGWLKGNPSVCLFALCVENQTPNQETGHVSCVIRCVSYKINNLDSFVPVTWFLWFLCSLHQPFSPLFLLFLCLAFLPLGSFPSVTFSLLCFHCIEAKCLQRNEGEKWLVCLYTPYYTSTPVLTQLWAWLVSDELSGHSTSNNEWHKQTPASVRWPLLFSANTVHVTLPPHWSCLDFLWERECVALCVCLLLLCPSIHPLQLRRANQQRAQEAAVWPPQVK